MTSLPMDLQARIDELERENAELREEIESHREWAEDVWNDPEKEPLKILMQQKVAQDAELAALRRVRDLAKKSSDVTCNTIDDAEARCMAVDGPIPTTLSQMTSRDLYYIWKAANVLRAALEATK